jgi:hypothetical protein
LRCSFFSVSFCHSFHFSRVLTPEDSVNLLCSFDNCRVAELMFLQFGNNSSIKPPVKRREHQTVRTIREIKDILRGEDNI